MKTLTEIYIDIIAELKYQFNVINPGKTFEAFAQVHAISLYLYLKEQSEIQKNFTPATSYSEALGGTLEAFGRRILGREPNPATQGEYLIDITGITGGTVTAGKQLRNDNNDLFEVQTTVVLTGTTGQVSVKSLDSGTDFELSALEKVYFTEPIANVDSEAVVNSVTVFPTDAETEEEYKNNIVALELIEPQGGSAADYRLWGLDATGGVNIFAYAGDEPNYIDVYVEANTANGVPTTTILEAVEAVIELNPDTTVANRGRRPLSAFSVSVLPVTPINIEIEITNLKDSSASVISTIEDAVALFLKTIRPHVDGADDPNERKDVLSLGDINTVVRNSLEVGNTYDNITLGVDSTEVSTFQFLLGNIPYLLSVTNA